MGDTSSEPPVLTEPESESSVRAPLPPAEATGSELSETAALAVNKEPVPEPSVPSVIKEPVPETASLAVNEEPVPNKESVPEKDKKVPGSMYFNLAVQYHKICDIRFS
jgi:hypothetical protein